MRIISKHIISFDGDYFGFLQDELKSLSKNIRKKFKEKIVKNYFVFGLVDVFAEKKMCMGCYHSMFVVIYFFVEEVAKQPVNVIFALDFLLTMTLAQELTRNLLLPIKTFAIC